MPEMLLYRKQYKEKKGNTFIYRGADAMLESSERNGLPKDAENL